MTVLIIQAQYCFIYCKGILVMGNRKSKATLPEIVSSGNFGIGHCSICLSAFNPNTMATLKNCPHTFHFDCISRSIRQSISSCPLCGESASESDIKRLIIDPPMPAAMTREVQ